VELLQEERKQQHAIIIGGVLKGILTIMYIIIVRQITLAMYEPNSLSLRGPSVLGVISPSTGMPALSPETAFSMVMGRAKIDSGSMSLLLYENKKKYAQVSRWRV
jgi:hypothetical protein